MNPLKSKNIVAKIIQVYAYVNAAAWVILAFVIADALNWGIAIGTFAVGLFASFLLYAFGEIIDLLQEIKSNTFPKPKTIVTNELSMQGNVKQKGGAPSVTDESVEKTCTPAPVQSAAIPSAGKMVTVTSNDVEPGYIKCPSCGLIQSEQRNVCWDCGTKLMKEYP